jgi:hypothetical protein
MPIEPVGLEGYPKSAGDLGDCGDRGDMSTEGALVERPLGEGISFRSLDFMVSKLGLTQDARLKALGLRSAGQYAYPGQYLGKLTRAKLLRHHNASLSARGTAFVTSTK